jgi:hypothetical protein
MVRTLVYFGATKEVLIINFKVTLCIEWLFNVGTHLAHI